MITQVYVQCLRRLKVILKYVMDHVENSAPVPVVILELGGNANLKYMCEVKCSIPCAQVMVS